MVGSSGSQTSHQQAYLLILCSMKDTKSSSEWMIGATGECSAGPEWTYVRKHTQLHMHTQFFRDATLFLTLPIYNPPTPYKMFHFQWESHKQLFPSHMTQAAKQYYKCRRFVNSSVSMLWTLCSNFYFLVFVAFQIISKHLVWESAL